jgi:hypothetical protein
MGVARCTSDARLCVITMIHEQCKSALGVDAGQKLEELVNRGAGSPRGGALLILGNSGVDYKDRHSAFEDDRTRQFGTYAAKKKGNCRNTSQ